MLDTNDVAGWILLGSDDALLKDTPSFLNGLLFETIFSEMVGRAIERGDRVAASRIEAQLFADALGSDWGVLALLASPNLGLLRRDQSRLRPLLDAALRAWPTYEAVGSRFTINGLIGERIWAVPNGVHFVLGTFGVPPDELSPTKSRGPSEVLHLVRRG